MTLHSKVGPRRSLYSKGDHIHVCTVRAGHVGICTVREGNIGFRTV